MAPKKVKAKGKPIETPVVSDKDVAAAKQLLKDSAENTRQRSNLLYFLASKGQKEEYLRWDRDAKNEFLAKHFAYQLANGTKKLDRESVREIVMRREKEHGYEWKSKQQLIDQFGEKKSSG